MSTERVYSPVYSMTGFARAAGHAIVSPTGTLAWTLTIKSVNHRFLDLAMRMPGGTESLEMELRRRLKEQVKRGHLEVTLTLERSTKMASEGAASSQVRYDPAVVAGYFDAFRQAAREHGLMQEPDLNAILRLPGIFTLGPVGGHGIAGSSTEERTAELQAVEKDILAALPELLAALKGMRASEGAALCAELLAINDRLGDHVDRVAGLHQRMQNAHFEQTRKRIEAMLGGNVDGARLIAEAAILAERSDVAEEIVRTRAHVAHFHELVQHGGELGKKLDFLLQEMNREANTLLSKTAGVSGEGTVVTELGLLMKSDIEKAREQVQNLE